jgi:hypothetical protein
MTKTNETNLFSLVSSVLRFFEKFPVRSSQDKMFVPRSLSRTTRVCITQNMIVGGLWEVHSRGRGRRLSPEFPSMSKIRDTAYPSCIIQATY